MKKTVLFVLTLLLLLSLLTGCSTKGNLSGTMADEPCELQEGTFKLYLADNLQGGFTFAQTEGGWTILDENSQYIAYDAENEAIIRTDESYDWVFSDGSFSTADGTVYLGDGLTVSTEAVEATFTKLVEETENPKSDSAENPKSEPTEISAPEGTIASLEVNGETSYYKTFSEAWNAANQNTDADVIVTLLTDVNGANGNFGELLMETRSASLTLDLNDHTLDRGLTTPTDCGAVFNLQEKGTVVIKNGTVTGGDCKGSGGCFYVGGGIDLTLENLTVTGNHTTANGSGIYLAAEKSTVTLNNVTITDNSADESGAVFWAIYGTTRATLVLKNKVVICSNSGDGGLCNLVYDGHGWCGWMNTDSMSTDSKIGVSYFDGYGGPLADSFGSRLDELKNCFFADQSNHDITSGDGTLVVKFKQDKAAVIHDGEWDLYDTFAQAWASANEYRQDVDAIMILFGDWVADSGGSFDDNGGYGGGGYNFDNGALHPRERKNHSWLILNLNGHTIDAGHSHRIVYMDEGIRMNIQNGTLKNGMAYGGLFDGFGGGLYVNDGDIQLDLNDLVITGNCAKMEASAIYVDKAESINFNTVTVENNWVDRPHSKDLCAVLLEHCDIRMYGKMIIRNNGCKETDSDGNRDGNHNLKLKCCIDDLGDINSDMAGSEIHLSDVTTYYSADSVVEYLRIFSLMHGDSTWGHRDITEDYATTKANAGLFQLDPQLKARGYTYGVTVAESDGGGHCTLAIFDYEK